MPARLMPIHDLSTDAGRSGFDAHLARLRSTVDTGGKAAQTVAKIIADVKQRGDEAVVQYMRQWTDPQFEASRIVVSADEIAAAPSQIDAGVRDALARSIEHVRAYQSHLKPSDPTPMKLDGATIGMRFVPMSSVGLAVPGGRASYPSSVIMLAAPALAAGVPADQIAVVCPPPTRQGDQPAGDISPLVLAACSMLGLSTVYRIGGAQAIAALALGTDTVEQVDLIVGPGNIFVQLAKQQLAGVVGIDGFYGPSEIVTIADDAANPKRIAADLLAQAEHDPGKCFLVAWSNAVIDNVLDELERQVAERGRREAIEAALGDESCAILAADEDQAIDIANTIAPEHMNLAVADIYATLPRITNAGEIFLGDQTPVAAGDYYAGPSHCLPTGTTARFTSGVSVYTFLKRIGTLEYPAGMDDQTVTDIARLAEAEGLDAHAASVRVRREP